MKTASELPYHKWRQKKGDYPRRDPGGPQSCERCVFLRECRHIVNSKSATSPYCFIDSKFHHRFVKEYEVGGLERLEEAERQKKRNEEIYRLHQEGRTLKEIADRAGVTKQRIHQLLKEMDGLEKAMELEMGVGA